MILFADDMGYAQPGFRGGDNGTIRTPHIDKLAAEGVVFPNWYSAFHVCSPSRFSMVTGRLPVRGGIGTGGDVFTSEAANGIPSEEITFAEALTASHASQAIGKWHLGQRPQFLPSRHGFDSFLGIPFSADNGISSWMFFNDSFGGGASAAYHQTPLPLMASAAGEPETVVEQPANLGTLTARYVAQATEFMLDAIQTGRPFLLYLAFTHVHAPNFASEAFCNTSARGPVGDAVQELDGAVGELLGFLDANRIANNTLVFFTSDNGAPLMNDCVGNGVLRDGKFTTWDGGIKVGGVMRWPDRVPAGVVSPALVATYDIFATVAAAAGVAQPTDRVIDGIDLVEVVATNAGGHPCLFHYHAACATLANTTKGENRCAFPPGTQGAAVGGISTGIAAVTCGTHKLHFYTKDSPGAKPCGTAGVYPEGQKVPPLLFDLATDPGESRPIQSTAAVYKAALATATAALAGHVATLRSVPDQMHDNFNSNADAHAYAVCGAPDSKLQFPQWPNCTLTPANFFKPTCAHSCGGGGGGPGRASPGNARCLCFGKERTTPFCRNQTTSDQH